MYVVSANIRARLEGVKKIRALHRELQTVIEKSVENRSMVIVKGVPA